MVARDLQDESGGLTQITMHAVRNLLGSEQQTGLFDENKVKDFAETFGVELGRDINQYGIDLSENQLKIMEAILHGLSQTNYKGNLDPVDRPSFAKEKKYTGDNLPSAYKYCAEIPKLKVTQSQLLQLARVNIRSAGDVQSALTSLKHLGTAQYCFYYTRLAFDEEGVPKKDKNGDWQKEEVVAIDTLFTVKHVRDKSGTLEYYEIMPSSIFLDQRESYHMLIPFNWREEVHKLIGPKKGSYYTFRFILLLRYLFEFERRKKSQGGACKFELKYTPEEVAILLKMPESVYKGKKDRMNKILEQCYSVSKQLGYLQDYERAEKVDILYLNEEKYLLPRHKEKLLPSTDDKKEVPPSMIEAKELLDYMIAERRKIDPKYNPVGGHIREQSLKHLVELLKNRNLDEIKEVVSWGVGHKFWITKVGTPSKLHQNFDDAIAEMKLSGGVSNALSQDKEQKNRAFADEIAKKVEGKKTSTGKTIKIELLNQHVEVGAYGESYPTSIKYSEKGFENQLESSLRKRGVSLG